MCVIVKAIDQFYIPNRIEL